MDDQQAGAREMKTKRITIACIMACLLLVLAMTGCGSKYNAPAGIIGQWNCEEYASDEATYTGDYVLTVNEDGSFNLYDAKAGVPGISGNMYCDDTGNLGIINLECIEEDFNPPPCWSLSQEARVRYKVIGEDKIKLGYIGCWLTFTRQ